MSVQFHILANGPRAQFSLDLAMCELTSSPFWFRKLFLVTGLYAH